MGINYKRSKIKFINPYTFVPTPRNQKVKRSGLEDGDSMELHTGVLKCRLFVRTPLGIPDAELEEEKGDHLEYPFFSYEDKGKRIPAIPGSSLRGPLRSVFETATDSCFSTLRKDTGLSKRVESKEAYKPGILKWENDTWHLYKADRYLLAVDQEQGYKKYEGLPRDAYVRVEQGGNSPRTAITQGGEKLRFGDWVEFQAYTEGRGTYRKNGNHLIWKGAARNITRKAKKDASAKGKLWGLIYIGETFSSKKHGESIFVPGEEVKDSNRSPEWLEKAYKGLLETLEIYRNPAINRTGGHSGYQDFSHAKKENGIPVWYDIKNEKLAAASIGRTFFNRSLNDLVGERKPCIDRKELCQACALFGMTGEESLGSRVRITDARAEGQYKLEKATLKILGQPRYSYMPFYARGASPSSVPDSYDEKNVDIAGRKFYWHNQKAAEERSVYSSQEKNKMNSTLELIMPGAEFSFDIYYDGITKEQLEKLMWCIHLGENQRDGVLCHKIGHGKPLGLGSVKMIIEERAERIFRDGIYQWEKERPIEDRPAPNLKNMNALRRVMNFNGPGGNAPIMYPDVFDEGGKPFPEKRSNDQARHKWYRENKMDGRGQNIQSLPNINKGDQTLYAYEKASDGEQRGNSWNNNRNNNRNSKQGGYR